ncbi:hypothetical protein ACETK8_16430 [Brevundimonas staleyi]|uniref:DUF3617 family protein n=1 Tax=Brevundimonas staleyi TaxID=74326 RepID=A0ABW0FZX5_9CAUL
MRRMGIAALVVLGLALPDSLCAQSSLPLTTREVAGQWLLRVTSSQRSVPGLTVNDWSQARSGLAFQVLERNGVLSCAVHAKPAQCKIDDGELVVTTLQSGATMVFTLSDRAGPAFAGSVRLRSGLLSFRSILVGTVLMSRRRLD